MLCHTVPYDIISQNTIPCHVIPYHITPYHMFGLYWPPICRKCLVWYRSHPGRYEVNQADMEGSSHVQICNQQLFNIRTLCLTKMSIFAIFSFFISGYSEPCIPHHTTPHHITPYHTIPYHTVSYCTVPHHTTPSPAIFTFTVSFNLEDNWMSEKCKLHLWLVWRAFTWQDLCWLECVCARHQFLLGVDKYACFNPLCSMGTNRHAFTLSVMGTNMHVLTLSAPWSICSMQSSWV